MRQAVSRTQMWVRARMPVCGLNQTHGLVPSKGDKGDKNAARPPEGSLVETRCLIKGPKSAIVPFPGPRSGPKSSNRPSRLGWLPGLFKNTCWRIGWSFYNEFECETEPLFLNVDWLVGFYGISTLVGYLTPNPFFLQKISSISNNSV